MRGAEGGGGGGGGGEERVESAASPTYPPLATGGSPDLRGRVAVVTGATRGIGYATAIQLAELGATVVIVARDATLGTQAVDQARRETGGTVCLVECDLASFASVRNATREIASRWPRVHMLINNAGVNRARRTLTLDSLETTIAVNHFAPFLMTNLLLPQLRAAAPARVVNVSSQLERWGRIDFSDINGAQRYSGTRAYLQSKLANVLFTYALAERLAGSGVSTVCVYPGLVATGLLRERWWWRTRWLRWLWHQIFLTPREAARAVVRAATAPVEGIAGMCFARDGKLVRSSRRSYDVEARERLWNLSVDMTRVYLTNGG